MMHSTHQKALAHAAQLHQSAMLASYPLLHQDFVHDIAFDFHGQRIASCSSDQKIFIWEKQLKTVYEGDEIKQIHEWELTDEIGGTLGHQAAVQRVKWADPEFGEVLASSSYDRQVYIWEQNDSKDFQKKQWTRRINFQEKEAVLDIQFAPKHWGLLLAVAVADGTVKIYASKDLNNLTQWQEIHDVRTSSYGCNSISWNPAVDEPQMFAVGCCYNANHPDQEDLLQIYVKQDKAFTLYSNRFKGGHKSTINDVSWAPLAGRSFHMIASCSKELMVIWKVTVKDIFSEDQALFKEPIIEQYFKIDAHKGEVWRLSWNLLATCIASSGEDGNLRIWKRNPKGFTQIACLQAKQ